MKNKNFKTLTKISKLSIPTIVFGLLFSFLGAVTSLLIPVMSKKIIDSNFDKTFILTLVVIIISSVFFMVLGEYILNIVSINFIYTLRKKISYHLFRLKLNFFNEKNEATLSSEILNFTEEIKNNFKNALVSSVSIFVSLCSIIILFLISLKLTLVLISTLLVMILIISPITSISSKIYNKNQEQITSIVGYLSHILKEIKLVKSSVCENYEDKNFDNLNKESKNLNIKLSKINSIIQPIITTMFITSIFIIFVFGGRLVAKNEITIGTLISFCLYIFQMLTPLLNLGNFINTIKNLNNLSKNICEIFEQEKELLEDTKNKDVSLDGKILFNNISFKYSDKKDYILRDFNLSIDRRKTIAIVGPSGSGKTTILNLLERFYDVNLGNITINDIDIKNISLKNLRNRISYVFQTNSFVKGTILDNLLYGLDKNISIDEINTALKKSSLYDFIYSLEKNVNEKINENGKNFSVGQLQRLMIAKSLLKKSDILLFDEITSSLDSESEAIIKESIENIKGEKTIIIVAHRLSTVKNADEIIFLEKGKITGIGNHEKLLQTHNLYRKYVENQLI